MIMLLFCIAVLEGCRSEPQIETQEAELLEHSSGQEESAKEQTGEEQDTEEDSGQEAVIYVQVSGAVVSPGVYELPEGSRVFEAVQRAGGMTEEADAGQMNQALELSDGEMVYVRSLGEELPEDITVEQTRQDDGKVDLNTATEEQLMTLPGIGEAKAKSIIAWREANGGFSQVEDLMKIEGIKEGVFSKVKDSIKVN